MNDRKIAKVAALVIKRWIPIAAFSLVVYLAVAILANYLAAR